MTLLKNLLPGFCFIMACVSPDPVLSQMPASPARLMPRNTIMLVETPNAEQLINHLKRDYYDQFYRWAISEEKMQPLDLTGARYGLKTKKIENEHWLATSVKSICKPSLPGARELLDSMKSFAENKDQISPDEEDEIVANLASLFPGRMFFGLENHDPYCTPVFGFEFAPETFDWFEELKATAAIQNGNEKAAGFAGDVPVFHLPLEEMYFFSVNNVVYGTSDVAIDSCIELANRVSNVPGKEESLEGSRHFARVSSSLDYDSGVFDVFCFARAGDFLKRKVRGCLDPDTGKRMPVEQSRWYDEFKFWGNDVGVSVRFDVEENYFKYRVVWPLLSPRDSMVVDLFDNALLTMDPKKTRMLPPFVHSSYSRVGDIIQFPDLRLYACQGFEFHSHILHQLYAAEAQTYEIDIQLLYCLDKAVDLLPETCAFWNLPGDYYGVFFDGSRSLRSLEDLKDSLTQSLDVKALAKERERFEQDSRNRGSIATGLEAQNPKAEIDSAEMQLMRLGIANSMIAKLHENLFLLPWIQQEDISKFQALKFTEVFVLDDWFGGELSESGELKACSIQRNFFGVGAQDGGVFPVHLIFSELSRQNSWSYANLRFDERRFREKRLSFLFQLTRAFGAEIQHMGMKSESIMVGDLMPEESLPLIYVNTLFDGESKVEYRGLMRSSANK